MSSVDQLRARLTTLMEINQLLMSTVEPDDLLREILQTVIRLFSAEGCSFGLIDDAARQVVFFALTGESPMDEFRINLDQGIAGWVARTGEGVISNDVSQDPRFFSGVDARSGFRTRSALCAPLRVRNRTVGIVEALNTTNPAGFTEDDLQLLLAFGSIAATAIMQAKAFASIRNAGVVLQEKIQDRYRLIVGSSPSMEAPIRLARTAAARPTTILLLGESGTGKEVVARAIHQWSPRCHEPFVPINCTALTPELLESELFGHEKGSFTGAIAQKKGRFELADGGTLFLDEIGDLAPNLQVKLLRVLQEKEFQRVGGTKDIHVDVRIIAATNRDLRQAIQRGAFREDLYYRLNVIAVTLPPLRERREDIAPLARYFVEHYCREVNRAIMGITDAAMASLQAYAWPGNVRELQNAIERAVVLSSESDITTADFPADMRQQAPSVAALSDVAQAGEIDEELLLAEAVDLFTRTRVRQALVKANGSQTEAAKRLGLPQSNLSRLMKRLSLR